MPISPRVSVVVIFWNAAAFIREAVESVFAQTYDAWELVLVDDGSSDESSAAAQEYARRHPERVRCFAHARHENRGMSASRNLGVRHARGEYVAFLDADDVWMPTILEDQVRILDEHPEAALVYGPIQYWFSWSRRPEDSKRDYVERLGVPADTLVPPARLVPLFLRDRAAVPSGLLVRKTALARLGGFEDAFKGAYEDQVFCAKVCLQASVFAAGQCWYRYRQHADSCVSRAARANEAHRARVVFLHWLAGYLLRRRVSSPQIWLALYAELRRAHYLRARQCLAETREAGRIWLHASRNRRGQRQKSEAEVRGD
jgi:glycosyltransferase involved in cell wall biosynthesis